MNTIRAFFPQNQGSFSSLKKKGTRDSPSPFSPPASYTLVCIKQLPLKTPSLHHWWVISAWHGIRKSSYLIHKGLDMIGTGVICYSYKGLPLRTITNFQSSLCLNNVWHVWHSIFIIFRDLIPWSKVVWRRSYQTFVFCLSECTEYLDFYIWKE